MKQEEMFEQPGMAELSEKLASAGKARMAEQSKLKSQLLDFIDQEANMIKGLASQSKKQLAKEVVHLRALVKTVKAAASSVKPGLPDFGHAEAFRLMTYVQVNVPEGEALKIIKVWNSRDGVTPFVLNIGAEKYEHNIRAMEGPFYDRPAEADYEWVTRQDWQVLEAWDRTMTKAVQLGKIDADKAESMRGSLEVAESWHYRIGLRNMATGLFSDDEALKAAEARPTLEQVSSTLHATGTLSKPKAEQCAKAVMDLFNGKAQEAKGE